MAAKNIYGNINFNNLWTKVTLTHNNFYLIAIKEEKYETDVIDSQDAKNLTFEIGIDSGINDSPLTIQYVTVYFEDITSGDNELNKITGFTRLVNFPKVFYIRPVSINDGSKNITDGEVSISVNINEVDLGNA